MTKLTPMADKDGNTIGQSFECPGCGCYHGVWIRPNTNELGASWDWNGDSERPTFTPSILARVHFNSDKPAKICHSFVIDGQIQFLNDCTHKLAGQTVPMLDVD